mmetsp:Transcript_9924/g.32826  ORF Transcript_9924/g.32826 Transcript_9924/m.32826 type:complete len:274 (-) Transcript_9924:312-1133(-)|eukprot:scaffold6764_cov115-Isochrysis_galbana.AAC.6
MVAAAERRTWFGQVDDGRRLGGLAGQAARPAAAGRDGGRGGGVDRPVWPDTGRLLLWLSRLPDPAQGRPGRGSRRGHARGRVDLRPRLCRRRARGARFSVCADRSRHSLGRRRPVPRPPPRVLRHRRPPRRPRRRPRHGGCVAAFAQPGRRAQARHRGGAVRVRLCMRARLGARAARSAQAAGARHRAASAPGAQGARLRALRRHPRAPGGAGSAPPAGASPQSAPLPAVVCRPRHARAAPVCRGARHGRHRLRTRARALGWGAAAQLIWEVS